MTNKLNSNTITGRINIKAFELLEENKKGVRWSDMLKQIQESDPNLHPKTINGCVWKLVENFPDEIYKPEKGLFRLKKYQ